MRFVANAMGAAVAGLAAGSEGSGGDATVF